MPRHDINIQDGFLFQTLKEGRQMAVSLTTGKAFKGTLKRFDRFAVVFLTAVAPGDEQEILVYKHAIVSISDVPGAEARTSNWSGRRTVRPPGASAPHRTAQGWNG